MKTRTCRMAVILVMPGLLALPIGASAEAPAVPLRIEAANGVDSRVDYAALGRIGPWDDRNYLLTAEDLALLAPNEQEQLDPIPAFFRVEMRRKNPGMPRTGEPQYPRSALQIFYLRHGGFLVDGLLYQSAVRRNGAFVVLKDQPVLLAEWETRALAGDVRITSPTGAAESAVKIHPLDGNKVVGGANGPGSGQQMFYSTNGGTNWTASSALPLGSTCCDPTVDWSSDGTKAYAATLGGCGSVCNVWVYRSGNGGATWNDLESITPGDPRREVTTASISDKEFIHVDKFGTSPRKDNVYLTWHDNNTLKFSRSTDFGHTWSTPLAMSSGTNQSGIGSDIATDKNGNVYYFWPATNGKTILSRKSTDGGATFAAAVTVAATQDGYDFAIPAMETRRAFIYVAADADLSNGAFANRVYVAWTDTTAPESGTPANNHARIQIAWSDNGTTWNVRTPHETADANTVDRFHPWIGVGSDGTVHAMYYDTRQNAARTSVDTYYSKSTDGGNTWSAPVRATSVTSPHIEDAFQWGDYNGLDVLGSQVIGVFTDNRNEGGGSADSIDVYAAAAPTGGGGCTPPAPPTGVTATVAGQTQINVSWTASAGATSYNILRSTTSGGPYTQVGTSATTSFPNTGLACNTAYHYVVQAVGACTSGNSAQATATTAACAGCTTTTLYTNSFDAATGLSDWTKGVFLAGGTTTNWRGVQACTAKSGANIFRYGGAACTDNYSDNDFNFATPKGATGIAVPANATAARLSFWHRHDFESGYDGGTLALSIDGTNYWYIPPSAILSGATYNGTLSAACPPSAGAAGATVFTGNAPAFTNTTVDLDAACNVASGTSTGCAGRTLRIAFTSITDCALAGAGWFLDDVSVTACAPPVSTALDFYTATPCRLVDTRLPTGPNGGPALQPGQTRTFALTGSCGIPATAKALSVNLTVTDPTSIGYLSLFPAGQPVPTATSISFGPGLNRANNALILLSAGGAIEVLSGTGAPVQFILDVNGWFAE